MMTSTLPAVQITSTSIAAVSAAILKTGPKVDYAIYKAHVPAHVTKAGMIVTAGTNTATVAEFVPETEAHSMTQKEKAGIFSDFHKDVYGPRPSFREDETETQVAARFDELNREVNLMFGSVEGLAFFSTEGWSPNPAECQPLIPASPEVLALLKRAKFIRQTEIDGQPIWICGGRNAYKKPLWKGKTLTQVLPRMRKHLTFKKLGHLLPAL